MKIQCNRREDILKRKAEYDADFSQRKRRFDDQKQTYLSEVRDRANQLADEVRSVIPRTSLDIEIDVTQTYSFRSEPTYEVKVHDDDHKFDDSNPLSWTWTVKLDNDGNVIKESSSWSGLKATTLEHIDKLKELVEVLQALNKIDWNVVLNNITPPRYNDYITESDPSYDRDRPDFDQELLEVDVEDMIGQHSGILCNSSKYYRGRVYRCIVKETPAQYTVFDIPESVVSSQGQVEMGIDHWNDFTYNIRKSTLFDSIVKPTKIIDLY